MAMLRQGVTILQSVFAAQPALSSTTHLALISRVSNSGILRYASTGGKLETERPVDKFNLQILLKSFELRYITEASTVIRDLILLNYAPKSRDLIRLGQTSPSAAANLFFPISDAKIPTKITKYTLLRSPHVNKTAREQFERRVHKRCITAPTTSYHELQWLIDSITSYEFSGVQIQLNISNSTFLQPASSETRYGSVLSQHMQRQAETFRLGEVRHLAPTKADDEIIDKLDAATSSISDSQIRSKVRSLVVAINEVLLKLRLPDKIDENAMAKAVSGLVQPNQPVDWVKVLSVVKYGQLLQKVAEVQGAAECAKTADEKLAGVYQAVASALLAAGRRRQQQQQQQ